MHWTLSLFLRINWRLTGVVRTAAVGCQWRRLCTIVLVYVWTAGAYRHGLQSIGKVARRMPPPANLPSLKSESQRCAVATAPPPVIDNTGTSVCLSVASFKRSLKCVLFARYWHSAWSALGICNDSALYKCTLNNNNNNPAVLVSDLCTLPCNSTL